MSTLPEAAWVLMVTVGRGHSIPVLQGFRRVHRGRNSFKHTWPVKWAFELGRFDAKHLLSTVRQRWSRM